MSPCRVRVFPVSCRVFFSVLIRVLVFFKNWHVFLAIHAILRYSCLRVVFIFLSVSCQIRIRVVFVSCRRVVSRIARSTCSNVNLSYTCFIDKTTNISHHLISLRSSSCHHFWPTEKEQWDLKWFGRTIGYLSLWIICQYQISKRKILHYLGYQYCIT